MSIVSGLATATGISTLLNAPRERTAAPTSNRGTSDQPGRPSEGAAGRIRAPGIPAESRVDRIARAETAAPLRGGAPSGDPRMVRFVEAVQALRLDADTASTLSPDRLSRLRDAARLVFKVARDIPREVRPTESNPEAGRTERARAPQAPDDQQPRPDVAQHLARRGTPEVPPDKPEIAEAAPSAISEIEAAQGKTATPAERPGVPEPARGSDGNEQATSLDFAA